ncbi:MULTISPECIES: XdhC family protein [Paenibacillus]|uniref:XdhC family protein n=1 Tax=Paenibacillus TaxID=44249 RepID=UPI0009E7CC55|nr:XdhC family protein [Paenibacillus sp. JMULE4]NTZ20588.1 hypothetical protein [Paenibacillus sp. JMULE4]
MGKSHEDIAYLGGLSSGSRIRKIVKSLRSDDVTLTQERLNRLFSPIGLDIGAGTPEEITLSIMGELVAHRRRRSGGFLREAAGTSRNLLTLRPVTVRGEGSACSDINDYTASGLSDVCVHPGSF